MTLVEMARQVRPVIVKAASFLSDQDASMAPLLFDCLRGDGRLIAAGTRIRWNGEVLRAAVDLWDTEENAPSMAPTLWQQLNYRQGFRIIPSVIHATEAFGENECGWWQETLYRSRIGSNVYTPSQSPENWEQL